MRKTNSRKIIALAAIISIGISMVMVNFASSLTIWKFSDGSTEKTINIATSPGNNSDAKITVPVGAEVTNIRLKLKQKVFSTKYIWVPLSYYGAGNDKVAQINVSDGSLVRLWDTGNNPSRLAVSPDGNEVWVANRDSANVTKIDIAAGTSVNYPTMGGPRGVTFDRDGNVWIGGGSSVRKLNRNGNLLLTLDAASNEPYLGTFTYGADTDPDGYVWFVGRGNGIVSRINPDNCDAAYCEIDSYNTGSLQLYGMGIDSKGDIWVAGSWDSKIFRVKGSSSGSVGTITEVLFLGRIPRGIAIDSQDNVWFADWNNATYPIGSIIKYNPATGNSVTYQDPNANGPLGISISIEETPPASGNFVEYVWVVNYYTSNATKLKTSDGSVVLRTQPFIDVSNFNATGKYNGSISFDGLNDEVLVPNSASLNPTNAITLEAWVYSTVFDNYDNFISKRISGGNQYILRTYLNTGRIQGYVWAGGAWRVCTTPVGKKITLNQWNHVVFTYNGATGKVYINDMDGIADCSFAFAGNIATGNDFLRIGGYGDASSEHFTGKIDEVRIYSRAITPVEATEHHNGVFNDNTGLVGYWNFDEGAGTVANDSSGNGNNGVLKSLVFPYNYSNMTGFRGPITELDIGNDGTKEWSVASYITETELNSASVASVLTSLASACTCPGCTLSGGDCTIDLTFSSTLMGTIELSSLRAEAPSLIDRWGDLPPPEDIAAGAPTNFEKAIMSIINAVLGFASIIGVLAMIFAAGLSLAAGVTLDPKLGILSKKTIIYTLAGLTIMGIGYAIVRVIVAVVVR